MNHDLSVVERGWLKAAQLWAESDGLHTSCTHWNHTWRAPSLQHHRCNCACSHAVDLVGLCRTQCTISPECLAKACANDKGIQCTATNCTSASRTTWPRHTVHYDRLSRQHLADTARTRQSAWPQTSAATRQTHPAHCYELSRQHPRTTWPRRTVYSDRQLSES